MPDDPVNVIQTTNNIHKAMQGPSIELYYEVPVRACLQSLFPQMFSFNQQTVQNMDNVHALLEDDEDCKNKEPFQGKWQRVLQVGD